MTTPFTVADAAVAIGADFRQYDAALGKKTTETRGRLAQLGQAVKKDFGIVFGSVAGGISAAGLKVGETWDSAFDTIRTSTGKTGEALVGLQNDLKAMAGTVEDSIGVQAQVLADLNKRTGQTGKSLQALAKTELDLARITKTDVNRNVQLSTRLFGDWSIATEDQAATLDKVYRASTATGIGVDTLMEKVVQFGSPLRLLGFTFEDSIALLSKWEKEGVNTETALSGLKYAVKTLAAEGVPAADMARVLQERIAAIAQSSDPVGDSLKLFGLRAGPDLAAAIKEGRFATDDLLEVINNGGDTIAQATLDTEDFGAQFAKLKNQVSAAIGPMLAGFGDLASTMGPLLYAFPALGGVMGRFFQRIGGKGLGALVGGFSSLKGVFTSSRFGQALASGLGSALGRVTANPAVSKGLDKLGNFMGSKLGKGLSLAFAAVAIFEVVETYNQIKAGLDAQSKQIGEDLGKQITAGTTQSLQTSKAALETGIKQLSDLWYNPFAAGQKDALQAQLDATNAELERRAALTPEALAAKLEAGKAEVDAAAADMVDGIPDAVDAAKKAAWETAGEIPLGIADAIRSRRSAAEQAMADLVDGIKNAMSPAQERARLIGYLTGDELRKALKSKDPALRAQAEASRDLWLAQLAEMPVGVNGLGKKAMDALTTALHDKNPAVRAEARRVKEIIEDQIRAAKAKEAGLRIDRNLASGINAGKGPVYAAVADLARDIAARVAGTIYSGRGPGGEGSYRAAGGPVEMGHAYWVGEDGPELFVPPMSGRILDHDRSAAASSGTPAVPAGGGGAAGAGNTYNIPLSVQGALPVRTIRDIATELRRVGELGLLPAPTLPPLYRRREAAGA